MKIIFNSLHFQMTDSVRLNCQLICHHVSVSIYIL